jgi:hypothetical protein
MGRGDLQGYLLYRGIPGAKIEVNKLIQREE